MFDPETSALIQSVPALPGLDPATLPRIFTSQYANLVAQRLRIADGEETAPDVEQDEDWPLSRIADAYELIASIHDDPAGRRAAAFVAGTAQQMLGYREWAAGTHQSLPILDRDRVDPTISAAMLFLAAQQYADSSDAARSIKPSGRDQTAVCTLLAESLRDFCRGNLREVLRRAVNRPRAAFQSDSLQDRGTDVLFEALLQGVELFTAEVLTEIVPTAGTARFTDARTCFTTVFDLSTNQATTGDARLDPLLTTYPGPRHLASLLLMIHTSTARAAITKIEAPAGTNPHFWANWLSRRATSAPFIWPNHQSAIDRAFYAPGKSAVLILPTGAGKTTVSCLKIAGTLGQGKNVVFLAPTHALVDQITEDLREIFPTDLLGSAISNDFDRLFATRTKMNRIEVMTPERCLALLSYAPESFDGAGLMVFDECHLLSPRSDLRRALDGMFCVLAFASFLPDADLLFLSAMLKNGEQFTRWIEALTTRPCIFADPLWKPSRQARGVVFYDEDAISRMQTAALLKQQQLDEAKGKSTKSLRKAAERELVSLPYALFGLQHNWLQGTTAFVSIAKISDLPVPLSGELNRPNIVLRPNVNKVAAQLATAGAQRGLKSIVFVNAKSHAISTAGDIAVLLGSSIQATRDEAERWNALEIELGGLEHSILSGPSTSVPHNSDMLRLERDLAEKMFRREDGAKVIVATPTLAQGLNLPAHMAILAGDRRIGADEQSREALAAHEILNAVARAGRAGHLANGIVLLVPEAILKFKRGEPLSPGIVEKLRSILPEDDRCLELEDPLQIVLDRISASQLNDVDVEYALNRFATSFTPENAETEPSTPFSIAKSFAAHFANEKGSMVTFNEQISRLKEILRERFGNEDDHSLLEFASQSGLPISTHTALRIRLAQLTDPAPISIAEWAIWVLDWLSEDDAARLSLLGQDARAILQAVGRKRNEALTGAVVDDLKPGVIAWIQGKPLADIEVALGGDPIHQARCPRSRRLITRIVPLSLSFAFGLVTRMAREVASLVDGTRTPLYVLDCLATAVRLGYDTPSKVAFAELRKGLMCRVQYHQAFGSEIQGEVEIEASADYLSFLNQMRIRLAG